ncbi:asparaginase [Francisellaceae bacterium]|nr:asparaginase [Francisellaceae bacterium]
MQNLKNILIVYTGGTIGMIKSARGDYIPSPGYLSDVINNSQLFKHNDVPNFDILEHESLIDSSNISPKHWQKIANDIFNNYNNYDGFVILHGTDTLAYSSSALSFMLSGLAKPVILTGAQIPVSQLRTDGLDNILDSLLIASNFPNIQEVCVYFNKKLFRGNRVKKVSADAMNAFNSPDYPCIGTVNININIHDYFLYKNYTTRNLQVSNLKIPEIAMINIFPGIQHEFMEQILELPLEGLIMRTYGAGNAPNDKVFLNSLKKACEKGVIIVNCSSCSSGTVDMRTYSTGCDLLEMGVVSGYDMTDEAALTKLYYLFGLGLTKEKIKQHMEEDLRGEVTIPKAPIK